ncbi:hypothetical protein [Pseudomonas alkylphenolica]|nr:hypothetical protein [Pseudomonas alkylphenolica]
MVNIRMFDHVVLGHEGCVSFSKRGYI